MKVSPCPKGLESLSDEQVRAVLDETFQKNVSSDCEQAVFYDGQSYGKADRPTIHSRKLK
jgi:hypothetical protein